MTASPIEPEPQGHPAWTELLNDVPEDLHPLLKPKLEEWERNYAAKLQGTVEQYQGYDAYKPLVENEVPIENIQKALWLAHQLDQNPEEIIGEAIKAFNLDYVKASESAVGNQPDDEEDFDMTDLSGLENHPAFKAIKEKAELVEQQLRQRQESDEEEVALNELQQELARLHQVHDEQGGFDDLYVTALMAQGVSPEDAVKSFNDTVNARAQALAGAVPVETPPVVMGGDGSSGSGVPSQHVKMGDLGKGDLNQMVLDLLNSNTD